MHRLQFVLPLFVHISIHLCFMPSTLTHHCSTTAARAMLQRDNLLQLLLRWMETAWLPHPSASHIFLVLHAGFQALIIHLVLVMIKHLSSMAAIHLGLLG